VADGTGIREERPGERRDGDVSGPGPEPRSRWLGRALLVARTNLRRQYRTARTQPWFAFAYLFSLAFGVFVAVGRAPVPGFEAWPYPGGYVLGGAFATGDRTAVPRVRGFAGVLFVLLVLVTIVKEATEGAMDTHVDVLLLSAGARSVAVGGVLWSLLLTGTQFGLIAVAGAAAFGVGAGSLVAAAGLVVAGTCLLVAAVPLGFLLSATVRLAFQRVPFARRHRVLLGAPLAVVYFALFARARDSMALLAGSPLGWFADLGLVAAGSGSLARGAAALGLVVVGAVGGTALSVPLSTRLWLGDDRQTGANGDGNDTRTRRRHERLLDRLVGRPTAAVTRSVWLRLRREPRSLVFVAMTAGIAATAVVEIVERAPAALPAVVAVYGATTVGMGATLNPLGAAGIGLPAALTTPDGGRTLVRGYALSAALPGVPLVTATTLLTGVATGLPAAVVGAAGVLAVVLALAAAVVSLAVGLAVPNVEGLRPTGSGLRPPKLLATTLFLLAMAVVGGPAFAGLGLGAPVGDTTVETALAGLATTGLLAAVAGGLAYRRALRTTGDYRIE